MNIYFDIMPTPIGQLTLVADAQALRHIDFESGKYPVRIAADWQRDASALSEARAQLDAYFAGDRHDFDLPLAPSGTPFQQRVWQALRDIDYGATISYAELARRLGDAKATRAVGAANGRNPLPIIVPCHRVIGADGSLTGFGGGLPTKRWLLQHEQQRAPFALG